MEMDPTAAKSLSWLLERVDHEERSSLTEIFPLIYEDLRQVAKRYMSGEKISHTLQPTALANEAFVRMRDRGAPICGKTHALALAAIAMRRILVDHARRREADKRGAGRRVGLTGEEMLPQEIEVLELDDLINRLAALDARRARVVELRFFAGMSNEEIAGALGIARSTVVEDWIIARAWLKAQLREATA
jgi:RNA polymerase sigma-70 factor, ECF subfamily